METFEILDKLMDSNDVIEQFSKQVLELVEQEKDTLPPLHLIFGLINVMSALIIRVAEEDKSEGERLARILPPYFAGAISAELKEME